MKAILTMLMVVMVAACSRKVQVETGAAPTAEVALHVTNNASQAVNVYVVNNGNNLFVGQVAANSTQHLPVAGVASGTVVTLQAKLVDGTKTYTRENVGLSGTTPWQVP